MLADDAGMSGGMARAMSYNHARPPTMIEQRLANGPASYGAGSMASHPYGYGAYNQGGFQPGQVVQAYTPTTANSANPFFNAYGDSPVGSPVSVAPYDSQFDAHGNLNLIARHPSNGSSTVLSRNTSVASKAVPDLPADQQHYVDMSRSSVTPFQAAQYVEISRALNTTPPHALPLAAVHEEDMDYAQDVPLPPAKDTAPLDLQPQIIFDTAQHLAVPGQPTPHESSFPESPFADPTMAAEQAQHTPRRPSEDSVLQPPAAAFAGAERERITSIPPTLPEIHLQERAFSPVTLDFPDAPASVRPSPSPFSTAFSIPSPPPNAHFPESPAPAPAAGGASRAAAKRPEAVYDDEDAYGGM